MVASSPQQWLQHPDWPEGRRGVVAPLSVPCICGSCSVANERAPRHARRPTWIEPLQYCAVEVEAWAAAADAQEAILGPGEDGLEDTDAYPTAAKRCRSVFTVVCCPKNSQRRRTDRFQFGIWSVKLKKRKKKRKNATTAEVQPRTDDTKPT